MFDPSTFSSQEVKFTENWEDNRFRLPTPGSEFVGSIASIEDGNEYQSKEGKTYMWLRMTLQSTDPPGTTVSAFLNNQPRPFGNKASGIEDLIQASGIDFDANSTHQGIAETVDQIWKEQIPFRFDITWSGSCSQIYKNTLMELTETTSFDDATNVADKQQRKEANKAAEFKANKFKVNGEYQATVECEQTNTPVRARIEVRNFLAHNNS